MQAKQKKAVVIVALLSAGVPSAAVAQVPNPLDWIFPHHQAQPGGAPSQGQGNDGHCSMEQRDASYINECGELIRGWQDPPVGGD